MYARHCGIPNYTFSLTIKKACLKNKVATQSKPYAVRGSASSDISVSPLQVDPSGKGAVRKC